MLGSFLALVCLLVEYIWIQMLTYPVRQLDQLCGAAVALAVLEIGLITGFMSRWKILLLLEGSDPGSKTQVSHGWFEQCVQWGVANSWALEAKLSADALCG